MEQSMLQPLIATLIVLLAAFWVMRKMIAVIHAARSNASFTSSCGSCGGCAKKTPQVVSLSGSPVDRSSSF
jgi:NADH:ubiquinone oxidoreductase subunit F (NADH-binding)